MGDIQTLKHALRAAAKDTILSSDSKLSDTDYVNGFELFTSPPNNKVYEEFIVPTLRETLIPLFDSRNAVSVLEIGPGPRTVLASLPEAMRHKINRYTAFEPNVIFATNLENCLESDDNKKILLPCLRDPAQVLYTAYELSEGQPSSKYDVVLLCHSMYGLKPKREFIEQAVRSLGDVGCELVVVFHRDGYLDFEGLVCHQTASFPDSNVTILDYDGTLTTFASFVTGIPTKAVVPDVRWEWRNMCRSHGSHHSTLPGQLVFHAPEIMVTFNKHAGALQELTDQVPLTLPPRSIKNRETCNTPYAAIVAPQDGAQVQECVRWALKYDLNLTVIGGSHSGQCVRPNVVAVDMSSFDRVHIIKSDDLIDQGSSATSTLIMVGGGCTTKDIIETAMKAGLTVPLGSRPSVGMGLPLQGGIGHGSRQLGLSCDSIVGAIMVSVKNGEVLCIGDVHYAQRPQNAVRPDNDADLLWALKGAGTNFGIVTTLFLKAYPAPKFLVREWVVPLKTDRKAVSMLAKFDETARDLDRTCSADPCIYVEDDGMQLGVTMYESSHEDLSASTTNPTPLDQLLGNPRQVKIVDCISLFDTDMYMSSMHGGHAGGKTSSFKRCVFLKDLSDYSTASLIVEAIGNRPSSLCYLHLLQGGGAIRDVPENSTAFGCRDWAFACVITGVWPREQDNTGTSRAAVRWVYKTVDALRDLSAGVYGADLGPDPRDRAHARTAFGDNLTRLARLKNTMDPSNILAYACPLPKAPLEPKIIFLVTGKHGAGKDYCADALSSILGDYTPRSTAIQVSSISDVTKREYARSTGADFSRLLNDRNYKEQHRAALTAFYQEQVQSRPNLPEEHFLDVVYRSVDKQILFITGMGDEAPVASFGHLVPDSRLIEIRIEANAETLRQRRGAHGVENEGGQSDSLARWHPDLTFNNFAPGSQSLIDFGTKYLAPLLSEDYQQLAVMVRTIPDFPSAGMKFRHVLGLTQQPGGLALCSSLMKLQLAGEMSEFDAIVCCETGGVPFATALATDLGVSLSIIREAGKLPPPTLSAAKPTSFISSFKDSGSKEKKLEIERDVIRKGAKVLIIDDVLATGKTLCAVLELMQLADVDIDNVFVYVIAEFPLHRGRARLLEEGFGRVRVRSLLTYGHL